MQKKIRNKLQRAYDLYNTGQLADCVKTCKSVLRSSPAQKDCLNLLGVIALKDGRTEDAQEIFERLSRISPNNPLCIHNLGLCYQRRGEHESAIRCFDKAAELEPASTKSLIELCNSHSELGNHERAIDYGLRACELSPHDAVAHNNLGRAYEMCADYTSAESCYRQATGLDTGNPVFRKNLGSLLLDRGDKKSARQQLHQAVSTDPGYGEAWLHLSFANSSADEHRALINGLENIVKYSPASAPSTADMHFAIARACDSLDDVAKAAEHYQKANAVYHGIYRFDMARYECYVDDLIATWTGKLIEKMTRSGNQLPWQPVFIVGMPRSGTSLTEQILASHPDVYGCGELTWFKKLEDKLPSLCGTDLAYPHCVDAIDPADFTAEAGTYENIVRRLIGEESMFTDKLPGNYCRIGLISAMLPQARFIYCHRDQSANSFSIYQQRFAGSIHWGYDLATINSYYAQHVKLMAHWREVMGERIFELEYENLVNDTDSIVAKMLEFLELEWDDACIRFHENRRHTHTSSNTQVSRPVYKDALSNWTRYSGLFAGL